MTATTAGLIAAMITIGTLFGGIFLGLAILIYSKLNQISRCALRTMNNTDQTQVQLSIMNAHLREHCAFAEATPTTVPARAEDNQ